MGHFIAYLIIRTRMRRLTTSGNDAEEGQTASPPTSCGRCKNKTKNASRWPVSLDVIIIIIFITIGAIGCLPLKTTLSEHLSHCFFACRSLCIPPPGAMSNLWLETAEEIRTRYVIRIRNAHTGKGVGALRVVIIQQRGTVPARRRHDVTSVD